MHTKYSIKDLEQMSGIKAHTLRAWESRYNLIEPYRTDTNIRYYMDDHLRRILNISALVKNGMKISKVSSMSNEEIHSAVLSIVNLPNSYESLIARLKLAMLEYDESLFESIVNKSLIQIGPDETLDKLLGVFIKEIGVLWQIGAIGVCNEHFISSLIKQKLYTLIDGLPLTSRSTEARRLLLFLPKDELHELSLLNLHYYFKRKGHHVVCLGQSVPLEHLKTVLEKLNVDYCVSVFTTKPHYEEMPFYFEKLNDLGNGGGPKFLITGAQMSGFELNTELSNIKVFTDIESLREAL